MQHLNLNKQVVLDLKKTKGIDGQLAQVVFVVDYSGSMGSMYRNGTVQKVLERLFPIAMAFDDNESMDFILFSNDYCVCPNVTMNNIERYVQNVALKQRYNMGGTDYTPVLKDIIYPMVFDKGWFSSKAKKMEDPVYVIFLTDGECSDRSNTYDIVSKLSYGGAFIQFIGIGHDNFSTLKGLDNMTGRFLDNANFFPIKNIDSMTDGELYEKMMDEFPSWIKQASAKGLIN